MRRAGNWIWRLRGSWVRYGVACLAAALAVVLQRWLELLTGHVSYDVFLIAVALSALYGGATNGMLALVLAGAGKLYFYPPERFGAGAGISTPVLRLLLFLSLGAVVSWLAGRLRTAHGQLTAALAGIGEAVAITGAEGRVVFLNPIAETLSGWTLKEAKGRPFQEVVHLVNEKTGSRIEDPIGKVMQTGAKPPIDNHTVLRSRDGADRLIEDSAAPLRDGVGKVKGVIVSFRDISSRRALEDRLRHAQNMEALRTLAGGVAHEFDNFLTVIAGHAELLSSRLAGTGPAPVREDVNEILKASERAVQLSRQLLLFGRRQVVQANPLSLNDRLSRLEKTIQSRLGGRIELAMRLDPHLGRVKFDAGQLEQVILNLAINAREAMPAGGRLTIRTANVHLDPAASGELAALTPGEYVEMEVSDNGNGMEEAVRARVFEPFFTTKPDGAGLGLSIAEGIVRQWGGRHLGLQPARTRQYVLDLPAPQRGNAIRAA